MHDFENQRYWMRSHAHFSSPYILDFFGKFITFVPGDLQETLSLPQHPAVCSGCPTLREASVS